MEVGHFGLIKRAICHKLALFMLYLAEEDVDFCEVDDLFPRWLPVLGRDMDILTYSITLNLDHYP